MASRLDATALAIMNQKAHSFRPGPSLFPILAAVALLGTVLAVILTTPQTTAPHPQSVAILPFKAETADAEPFAFGLADELITVLTRSADLRVAARSASFALFPENAAPDVIAEGLNVAHLVTGAVRLTDHAFAVQVALQRAQDGAVLWRQSYEQPRADIFAVEQDIAFQIARALDTLMDDAALAAMADVGTSDVEAYFAWLSYLDADQTAYAEGDLIEGLAKAYTHAERARKEDPGFARAHAAAASYWELTLDDNHSAGTELDLNEATREERFRARIAAAIDAAEPPWRWLYEADLATFDLRFADAADAAARFVDGAPNAAAGAQAIHHLLYAARFSEASNRLRRAMLAAPNNVDVISTAVYVSFFARDFALAAEAARILVRMTPDDVVNLYQAHRALLWAGDVRAARRLAPTIAASDLPSVMRDLAALRQYCAEGQDEDARRLARTRMEAPETADLDRILVDLMFNRVQSARARIAAMEAAGRQRESASVLGYPQVDWGWSTVLARAFHDQGLVVPDRVPPPFACDG